MLDAALIYKLAIWAVPIVLAITLHEAGHAWAAYKLGDNTSKELGRVTLNPIPHIDIIGTIVLPLVMYLTSPILFGWAKPVPVNARNFKQPRKDMAMVALAGPFANFAMVLGWAVAYKVCSGLSPSAVVTGFANVCLAGIFINLLLAFFNLFPFPPLDGGRVLMSILPPKWSMQLGKLEPFGIFIVVGLFMFAGLGTALFYLIQFSQIAVLYLVGVAEPINVMNAFFKSMSAS